MDAVSEILVDRSREADKFSRMVIVSLVIHGVILSALAFIPSRFDVPPTSENVIEISCGGSADGPVQGRNPTSAKPVKQAVPDAKPRVDTAPAAAKPEMGLPTKPAKVEPTSTKPKTEPARVKPPSQGAEVKQGTARDETHGV